MRSGEEWILELEETVWACGERVDGPEGWELENDTCELCPGSREGLPGECLTDR